MTDNEHVMTASEFFRLFPQEITAGYEDDARQQQRREAFDYPSWCHCSDIAVQLGAEGLLGYAQELDITDVPGIRTELDETLRYLYEVLPDLYHHHMMTPQRECAIESITETITVIENKLTLS